MMGLRQKFWLAEINTSYYLLADSQCFDSSAPGIRNEVKSLLNRELEGPKKIVSLLSNHLELRMFASKFNPKHQLCVKSLHGASQIVRSGRNRIKLFYWFSRKAYKKLSIIINIRLKRTCRP